MLMSLGNFRTCGAGDILQGPFCKPVISLQDSNICKTGTATFAKQNTQFLFLSQKHLTDNQILSHPFFAQFPGQTPSSEARAIPSHPRLPCASSWVSLLPSSLRSAMLYLSSS